MELDLCNRHKQTATEFWKSYFAKFRRSVADHEPSETQQAALFAEAAQPLYFPERRVSGLRRNAGLRIG